MSEKEGDRRHRKGRALLVASVAVLVYVWAGGQFIDQGFFGGGGVRFEYPCVLEAAGLAIFAFLFWGHVTPSWNPTVATMNRVREYMLKSRRLDRSAREAAVEQVTDRVLKLGAVDWVGKGDGGHPRVGVWRDGDGKWVTIVHIPRKSNAERRDTQKVTLENREVRLPRLYAILKALIFHEEPREDLLPLVLASLAALSILARIFSDWGPLGASV